MMAENQTEKWGLKMFALKSYSENKQKRKAENGKWKPKSETRKVCVLKLI